MSTHLLLALLLIVAVDSIFSENYEDEPDEQSDVDDDVITTKKPKMLYYILLPVNRNNYNKVVPADPVYYRMEQNLSQCLDLFEKCFQDKEGFKQNDGKIDWECRTTTGCEEFGICTDDNIEERTTDCVPEIGDHCIRKLTEYHKKYNRCFTDEVDRHFPGCDVGKHPEKVAKTKFRSIRQSCKHKVLK